MSVFHQIYTTPDRVIEWIRKRLLDADVTPEVDGGASIGSESKQLQDIFVNRRAYLDGLALDNHISKTNTYTALATDSIIFVDTTSAFTITLPSAGDVEGQVLTFIKTDVNANALTLECQGSETIDGGSTYKAIDAQHDTITIISDGSNWFIISKKVA